MSEEIKGDAPLSPYTGVPGWETQAEQALLISFAAGMSSCEYPAVIVEIGSENGMSASIWAQFTKRADIYCIEINPDANFLHNLQGVGGKERVTPIFGNSANLNWQEIRNVPIDLLFIDGDHSYEGALADLRNFAPYVIKDGWMLLHDTACSTNKLPHTQHKDVSRAIETFMQEQGKALGFQFMFSVDSISVFRRFL